MIEKIEESEILPRKTETQNSAKKNFQRNLTSISSDKMCNFTPKKVHKIRGNKSQEKSKKEVNTKVNEKKINLIINYFQANIKGKNKEEENWKTFKNRENILPEKKKTPYLPFSALKSTSQQLAFVKSGRVC